MPACRHPARLIVSPLQYVLYGSPKSMVREYLSPIRGLLMFRLSDKAQKHTHIANKSGAKVRSACLRLFGCIFIAVFFDEKTVEISYLGQTPAIVIVVNTTHSVRTYFLDDAYKWSIA